MKKIIYKKKKKVIIGGDKQVEMVDYDQLIEIMLINYIKLDLHLLDGGHGGL